MLSLSMNDVKRSLCSAVWCFCDPSGHKGFMTVHFPISLNVVSFKTVSDKVFKGSDKV